MRCSITTPREFGRSISRQGYFLIQIIKRNKKTLLKCSYDFEQECYLWTDPSGISQAFFLVHRLDSATSGVLLATSSEDLAIELKNAFAQRLVHKTYHAIVEFNGRDIPPLWKDTLIKKSRQGKIRVVQSKTGQPAVTQVSIERRKKTLSTPSPCSDWCLKPDAHTS